ncbi:hypothetical protein OH77DRAFT_830878 [Trametes cingulata]|nr:hypothetical protein OH77DRAFT_830878 [Trametes cingulata]
MTPSPTEAEREHYRLFASPQESDLSRGDLSGRTSGCTSPLAIVVGGTFGDNSSVPRSPASNATPTTVTPHHRHPPTITIPHDIGPDFWTPTHGHGDIVQLSPMRSTHNTPPTPTRPMRSSIRFSRQRSPFSSGHGLADHPLASLPDAPHPSDAEREAFITALASGTEYQSEEELDMSLGSADAGQAAGVAEDDGTSLGNAL